MRRLCADLDKRPTPVALPFPVQRCILRHDLCGLHGAADRDATRRVVRVAGHAQPERVSLHRKRPWAPLLLCESNQPPHEAHHDPATPPAARADFSGGCHRGGRAGGASGACPPSLLPRPALPCCSLRSLLTPTVLARVLLQAGFLLRDALAKQATFKDAVAYLGGTKAVMKQCVAMGCFCVHVSCPLHPRLTCSTSCRGDIVPRRRFSASPLLVTLSSGSRRYLAISGVSGDEGAIMTRNRESIDTSHGLDWGLWRINVSAGAWYRIVSNYDPWLPDPASDPVCVWSALCMSGRLCVKIYHYPSPYPAAGHSAPHGCRESP